MKKTVAVKNIGITTTIVVLLFAAWGIWYVLRDNDKEFSQEEIRDYFNVPDSTINPNDLTEALRDLSVKKSQ
jgi:hypothetical protein